MAWSIEQHENETTMLVIYLFLDCGLESHLDSDRNAQELSQSKDLHPLRLLPKR
jgi:hypothetical protein